MSTPEPILDYASPRKRSSLRMAATSVITWDKNDYEFSIIERLTADKSAAVTGLSVAALTFFGSIGILASDALAELHRSRNVENVFVPPISLVLELFVAVLVVHQTWRRTELRVSGNQLDLTFWSPLRVRRYHWNSGDLVSVSTVITAADQKPYERSEMMIVRTTGSTVHLFTDHPSADVAWLTAQVESYLGTEPFRPGK